MSDHTDEPVAGAIVPALDAETTEQLKRWRHALQCVFAEERARQKLATAEEFAGVDSMSAATYRAELATKGVCLDAALLALDESFRVPTSTVRHSA